MRSGPASRIGGSGAAPWRASLLALALALAACGGADKRAEHPPVTDAERVARADDYSDENSVGMPAERISRWRWKGERKQCFFVVGNDCFTTEQQACRAAKCPRDRRCAIDDSSAPARASCVAR